MGDPQLPPRPEARGASLGNLCRLRGVKITLIPDAQDQMHKRGVSEDQVRQTVEKPDTEREGRLRRTVAEKRFEDDRGGRFVRVVYNQEGADEAVVVTVITHRRRSQEVAGEDQVR